MNVVQVVPDYYQYDAISQHAGHIRTMLSDLGIPSRICARRIVPDTLPDVQPIQECISGIRSNDLILFHYSIYTPLIETLKDLPCRKVMVYHNITPARFFDGISKKAFEACRKGRTQLQASVVLFDLALGVSRFNEAELKEAGFRATGILPLVVATNVGDDRTVRSLFYLSEKITLLHVGKWAPNKKIEDLVSVFYWVHRLHPESRLILVGRNWEWENYTAAVTDLIQRFNLQEIIKIIPRISAENLAALYRASDLYLTMSEHEGFCVPLIEAMASRCPVLAYEAGAVPETVRGAGLLFKEKNFPEIAEAVLTLMERDTVMDELKERGTERAAAFSYESVFKQFQGILPVILGESRN